MDYLPHYGPWRDILHITNLMILHLTFISTVSIAATYTSCPTTHTIFLLLTQSHRPTLDACFHNPFYLSLVYMHPQCMIFNLGLMPPSEYHNQSIPYMEWMGFSHTFQFFIFKGLGPFSLLVQANLVTSIAYKISFSNYFMVYLGSECTKLQLWW